MEKDSQEYKDHMIKVRERQNAPDFFPAAEAKVEKIKKRLKDSNVNALGLVIQEDVPIKVKILWLNALTDTLGKAMEDISPCKIGCSHCCKMAVNITPTEAEAISAKTGIPAAHVQDSAFNELDRYSVRKFSGVPCPFLLDDKCSIYDVRPFACRVHYSVDMDNLLCQIVPGEDIHTVSMNSENFNLIHIAAHGYQSFRCADIRYFFPPKE